MLIKLNINSSKLYYNKMNVKLTLRECKMFVFLMEGGCSSIDYSLLVSNVWPERGGGVTLNAVSQLAYRLRDKMKSIGAPVTIKISLHNGCEIKFNKKIIFIIKGKRLFQCKVKAFL